MPCSTARSIEGTVFYSIMLQSSKALESCPRFMQYLFIQKDHVSYGFRDLLVENSGIGKSYITRVL